MTLSPLSYFEKIYARKRGRQRAAPLTGEGTMIMAIPNDEELQKTLKNFQEHTGPFDEQYTKQHVKEFDFLSTRLNGDRDKLFHDIRDWFDKHFDDIKEHLHEDREKIEKHLHDAHKDIDKHLEHQKADLHKCHEKIDHEADKLKKDLHL